jgi:hypothetical protein
MSNITIGRYGADEAKNSITGRGFSAWIEGVDDAGEGWVLWLDENGRPIVYFGHREKSGAVLEPRIHLVDPPAEQVCGVVADSALADLVAA